MGPRLFGIPAREADVVAVIRRGPSGWCQVNRWDPLARSFTSGAWLHGTIYPQRCDVSPDGRWLAYFALKSGSRWDIGDTYLAISRLPWLTALAAWSTCGTWTRGVHFVAERSLGQLSAPDEGDLGPLLRRFGLAATRAETFSVERRNGWRESEATPPRSALDIWDERRADQVIMEKQRPAYGGAVLHVNGRHAAFRDFGPAWGRPDYWLAMGSDASRLDGVQWADWDRRGRLLVATVSGTLQIRMEPFRPADVIWTHDLADMRPDPMPPPAEAHEW